MEAEEETEPLAVIVAMEEGDAVDSDVGVGVQCDPARPLEELVQEAKIENRQVDRALGGHGDCQKLKKARNRDRVQRSRSAIGPPGPQGTIEDGRAQDGCEIL